MNGKTNKRRRIHLGIGIPDLAVVLLLAGFLIYAGDGTPPVSNAEQIRIAADAVIDRLQNESRQGR